MKNITRYGLLLFTLILFGVGAISAQERDIKKGREEFSQMKYVNTQEIYKKIADKGYESEELFTKLGDSYYYNAEYDKALHWYQRLFEYTDEKPKDIWSYLRYAQALKANGNLERSKHYYDIFLEKTGRKERGFLTAEDYLKRIDENSNRYSFGTVEALYDEDRITYGKTVHNGDLYYSTTKEQAPTFLNTKDAWTGMSFIELERIAIDSTNQTIGKPERLKGNKKYRFHTSSPVYTKDGKTVYFTRNNTERGKKKEDVVLMIYRSQISDDGKWSAPEKLNINDDTYNTAHPALSPNEDKLYFASDRLGGQGQSDLYVVEINKDGSLGQVESLGEKINTGGKETFPFVTADNELYFSSDGHYGLGGLDVFYVKINDDGSFGRIINVGRPINSHADDFAFGIDSQTKYGFVSSNRGENSTFVKDNIYSFKEITPLSYMAIIDGCVVDIDTEEPLPGSTITLTEQETGNQYKVLTTDDDGCYTVEVDKFATYSLLAEKENYDKEEKLSEPNVEQQTINFKLRSNKIEPGVDLAKLLNIPIIHFDFDQSNIRPDAEVELQKVLAIMEEYPELKINIRSHTDSRGSAVYNQGLSERRAQSTFQYLVDKGIAKERMTYEGLGESELLNGCDGSVPCTEAQHQLNRRSEFIVVE